MPVCKVENCECLKQEIPLHLVYWLAHQGIDIRPLFQRPYITNKKKSKSNVKNCVSVIETENETNLFANENEVLNEFLQTSWTVQPDNNSMETNVNSIPTMVNSVGLKRSVPYKIPASNKRRV